MKVGGVAASSKHDYVKKRKTFQGGQNFTAFWLKITETGGIQFQQVTTVAAMKPTVICSTLLGYFVEKHF